MNKKKTTLLAALAAFQIAGTANASHGASFFTAENDVMRVSCEKQHLNRYEALYGWPGMVDYGYYHDGGDLTDFEAQELPKRDNHQILTFIDRHFAGSHYFDKYPHKLPGLFERGACVIESKYKY